MNFDHLVNSIEQTHKHFQRQAAKAVNVSLTIRNWLVGYYIVEFELHGEDRASYGEKLFTELAARFKSIKGIDRRALYRFKDFYLLYPHLSSQIASQVNFLPENIHSAIVGLSTPQFELLPKVGLATPQSNHQLQVPAEKILFNLSYTHIEQLLQIEDMVKRTFYEIACINGTWSVQELKRQINTLAYERMGLSANQEKAHQQLIEKISPEKPEHAIKNIYTFDFLEINTIGLIEENELVAWEK